MWHVATKGQQMVNYYLACGKLPTTSGVFIGKGFFAGNGIDDRAASTCEARV
jgi:hypothetical protein